MNFRFDTTRLIPLPYQIADDAIGIRGESHCWLFAKNHFRPSIWLLLKREGFTGSIIDTSNELDTFKYEVGLGAIRYILSFHHQRKIHTNNPFQLWQQFEELLLMQQIQVYEFSHADALRLTDPNDRYYATPESEFTPGNTPVETLRNRLAEQVGTEILQRWKAKTKADGAHFSLPWYTRELHELTDIHNAVGQSALNVAVGIKDTAVFICKFAYESTIEATITATTALENAARFQLGLVQAIAQALSGDSQALEEDLMQMGLTLAQFGYTRAQAGQEYLRTAKRISDKIVALVHEGHQLFNLLTKDAQTRNLLWDYFDSLVQSTTYRDSRVKGLKVVSEFVFELSIDVAIGLATGGAGVLASRAARVAKAGQKASASYGPFKAEAMDTLADLAKAIKGQQSVGKATPAKSLDIPDYATTQPKQKPKQPPKPTTMAPFKPDCFQPSNGLKETFKDNPKKLEKEFYRQLKDQEAGINKLTVGQYLDNRQRYQDLIAEYGNEKARQILTDGGKAQKAARLELENKITKSVMKNLEKQGIYGMEAKQIAQQKAKDQLTQLAALHDPDMIAGGKDQINRLGNKNINSSLGSQWKDRTSKMDSAAKRAANTYGRDTQMNVELERCKH